jgi:ubiquinone/menaquinone biosynthesis C-methylase UbiE
VPELRSWNEMAEWFDSRQGDEGDRWHRELIYPCVKQVAGNVAGLRTLDVACGNGSLTRWLKRQGAAVTGTDATLALLQHARRRESESPLGIEYVHSDAARLEFAATSEFDLVICTMALMDMPDAEGPIREIARVMKPHARAVICISHPCFDVPQNSDWIVEVRDGGNTNVWRKVRRYREIFAGPIGWSNKDFYTLTHHRPLQWYFRALRSAGLCVTAFEEPSPTDKMLEEDDEAFYVQQIPVQCVMEARKWRG